MRPSFLPKCKPKITRISVLPIKQGAKKNCLQSPKNHPKKCYDPCLYGRAEILVIFGLHFGRNEDLLNSEFNWPLVGEKKKNEMGLSRQSVYVPTQSYSLQSGCRRPSRPRRPTRLPHQPWEKVRSYRGCRIVQGWIELSVFIRKRSGSICLCPREISNLYLLRLLWRLLEAAGGCWEARRTS